MSEIVNNEAQHRYEFEVDGHIAASIENQPDDDGLLTAWSSPARRLPFASAGPPTYISDRNPQ